MPFLSEKQRKACWAQYHRDLRAGIKPRWDCKEWEAETKTRKIKAKKVNGRVVRTGPQGGKYIIQNGKKKYLK